MTKQQKNRPVELISQTELAKRKGCNKSTAHRACKGVLSAAMVGKEVDASHPAVRKWLSGSDQEPPPSKGKKGSGPLPTREEFTKLAFRKRKAEAERLELANGVQRGELISRELVAAHVIGLLDAAFKQLLRDVPRTQALRLYSLARADNPQLVDGEHSLRDAISTVLTRARAEAVRALRKRPAQQRASEATN